MTPTTPSPISDQAADEPIPMLLFCPKCHAQHIDKPEPEKLEPYDSGADIEYIRTPAWTNPPHKSHLCRACKNVWRPADVATTGVASIKTKGKADTWDSTAPTAVISDQAAGELLPCPFCSCKLLPNTNQGDLYVKRYGSHFDHPGGLCFLADAEVSPAQVEEWNTRSTAPTTGSAPVAVRVCPISDIECASARECESVPGKCRKLAAPASPAASILAREEMERDFYKRGFNAGREQGWTEAPAAPIDQIASILACEIECSIFEQHVAPALEVARKAIGSASPAASVLTDEQIREIFMAHGFTIKEGQSDLKPYVYEAAHALLAASMGGDKS